MQNQDLSDVMRECLKNTNLWYRMEGDIVVISPKFERQSVSEKEIVLTGVVKEKKGDALPGVTIMVKDTRIGTSTDTHGRFKILLPPMEKTILVFSFVGMNTQEFVVKDPAKPIEIVLEEENADLDEVVITGIYTRKKESFTGSSQTYKTEDLKMIGTQNIIQSLKTLDPAFNLLESKEYGSPIVYPTLKSVVKVVSSV